MDETYVIITIVVCVTFLIKVSLIMCYYSKCTIIKCNWKDGLHIERDIKHEPELNINSLALPNTKNNIMMDTIQNNVQPSEDLL